MYDLSWNEKKVKTPTSDINEKDFCGCSLTDMVDAAKKDDKNELE